MQAPLNRSNRTALQFVGMVSAALAACLCGTAEARQKLSYEQIVRRLYDLEQLADPPAKGEASGNWSSRDRRARYNPRTSRYENWQQNRKIGGQYTGFLHILPILWYY